MDGAHTRKRKNSDETSEQFTSSHVGNFTSFDGTDDEESMSSFASSCSSTLDVTEDSKSPKKRLARPSEVGIDDETSTITETKEAVNRCSLVMPSQDELESFFASLETEIRSQTQHFMEKYNYDFVKDQPIEGRFEWTKLSL